LSLQEIAQQQNDDAGEYDAPKKHLYFHRIRGVLPEE
jgi:hypothetical protein